MPPTAGSLDPVTLLVACRKLGEAETLASERLTASLARLGAASAPPAAAPPATADRLAAARAEKALAEILLEAGETARAAPHVYEARRRYRPFLNDPALAAEVSLTLAEWAFADDRSLEGEQILAEGIAAAASVPGAELPLARLLRYAAHVQIVRTEYAKGEALLEEALSAVQRSASAAEAALLRSQFLFTQGEVAHMRGDGPRARAATLAALDLAETALGGAPAYVQFARGRAAHAQRVFDDGERADESEGRSGERHG